MTQGLEFAKQDSGLSSSSEVGKGVSCHATCDVEHVLVCWAVGLVQLPA